MTSYLKPNSKLINKQLCMFTRKITSKDYYSIIYLQLFRMYALFTFTVYWGRKCFRETMYETLGFLPSF